jgi:DNA repair protein RadA/Sms
MKIAFISNEETKSQILNKTSRLGIENHGIDFHFDWKLPEITSYIREQNPDMVVIDSIQTITTSYQSQVETAKVLKRLCNLYGCTFLVIGHENKNGNYTGARAIEHELDVILEMKKGLNGEIIASTPTKNRLGPTGNRAVFRMTEIGLVEKAEDETGFLLRHQGDTACGTASFVSETQDGYSVDEITVTQNLASDKGGITIEGCAKNRTEFLVSVVQKNFKEFDPNCIARANLAEKPSRSVDLAAIMAVLSYYYKRPIPFTTVFLASIDAEGVLLPLPDMAQRTKRAYAQGYTRIFGPIAIGSQKAEWTEAATIRDVWEALG